MSKQYLTLHTVDNAHITDIFSLAATPTALFSASGSSTLNIHSTTSPTFPIIQSISGAHRLGIHHVCTSRGGPGRVAVSAGFGGELKIWTCKEATGDWELWHEIRPGTEDGSSSTTTTNGSTNGSTTTAPANGSPQKTGDAWAIALSADENYLAVTTHDGKIHVWDLTARQRIQTYETGGGGSSAGGGSFGMAVDLSRDGRLTASGHQNGGVYVFNNDTGRMVYSLSGLAKPVRAVAFSPGCKKLAAAGDAGIIAIYDMEHGEHVGNLSPSSSAWITSVDWNDTGEYLLSGALDGRVRVWDVARGVCVATHSETDKALWSARWLPKTERAPAPGMGRGEMFCAAGANRSIVFYREATGT